MILRTVEKSTREEISDWGVIKEKNPTKACAATSIKKPAKAAHDPAGGAGSMNTELRH